MILQPGTTILDGKYRVEAFLGKGASAEVFRVTHVALKARRAIKILRRDNADPGVAMGSTDFGDFRRRFELEAQLGAQLNSANIVHVYDFIEHNPRTLMLVMEYAAGGSLTERLARLRESGTSSATMPVGEAVGIALDVASGLTLLHARDTVHRDLKPSNILLDADGHAKVADLGLAQVPGGPSLRSQISAAAPHPGTPAYMSPEQTHSSAYLTPASDIYSLGLVLFEMLTGRTYKNVRPGTRVASLRADVPVALDDLVARMLSKDAEARPFDGAETASLLNATGIAPAWNRDDAWQREREQLAAAPTFTASVAMPTPAVVRAPMPEPTHAQQSPAPKATLASAEIAETLPPPVRPAVVPQRKAWVAPALGLAVLAALAAIGVAVLPGLVSQSPTPTAPGGIGIVATPAPTSMTEPTTAPASTDVPLPTAAPVPTDAPIPPADTPVPPTAMPAIANFDGTWSTNFATLSLRQSGTNVSGTYQRYGYNEALDIQGTISGRQLIGFFKADTANVFTFNLSSNEQRFDGEWRDKAGTAYQWCGVRSGPLPDGCGFSGKWFSIGDYKVNYPPTIELVQVGAQVKGTFLNGVETSPGTVTGFIGVDGDGSHYTASGQWAITKYNGPFRWVLVDFARSGAGQFQGRSVTADGKAHQWCGWRAGLSQPSLCMDGK